jgi:hypothetical protein
MRYRRNIRRADHMKATYVIMAMLAVQRGDAYGSEVYVSYHMLLLSSGMMLTVRSVRDTYERRSRWPMAPLLYYRIYRRYPRLIMVMRL